MERNFSIDYIKFFAIFAVVSIHTGTVKGVFFGGVNGDDINFMINIAARFAVPFFFAASGYLFMQKMKYISSAGSSGFKQTTYFMKYIFKLIKLWLAWCIFYLAFDATIMLAEGKNLQAMKTELFGNLFTWETFYYGAGHSQYHLWFLLALIWSVFILFIFLKMRLVPLLFIVSLVLNVYGVFGQSYSEFLEVGVKTRDALFFGLFYTAMGSVMALYENRVKGIAARISTPLLIAAIFAFFLIQWTEAYVTINIFEGERQDYFLSTIPLSLLIFTFAVKHSQIGKGSLISKIGANAVGIYVTHIFIMIFVRRLMDWLGYGELMAGAPWKLLFTPGVFIMAYLFYMAIQHVKAKGLSFYNSVQKKPS